MIYLPADGQADKKIAVLRGRLAERVPANVVLYKGRKFVGRRVNILGGAQLVQTGKSSRLTTYAPVVVVDGEEIL